MSRWHETFKNHGIHTTLEELQGFLIIKPKEIDSEHEAEKRRLVKIVDMLVDRVASVDPELFQLNQLDALNNHLRHGNFHGQLSHYVKNRDVTHLRSANEHINSFLPTIQQLVLAEPAPVGKKNKKALEEAYDQFCGLIDKKVAEFDEELAKQGQELDEVKTEHNTLTEEMANLRTSNQEDFQGWQEQFDAVEEKRSELFLGEHDVRGKEFELWLTQFQHSSGKSMEDMIGNHNDELIKSFKDFTEQVDKMKEDANARHASIVDLHGLVATDSVAAGYKKNADDEQRQADIWRYVAMAFIAATAAWIGWTFYLEIDKAVGQSFNWPSLVKVASLTGVLLFGAVYASKQSSLHRENEKQTRWFSLEVMALDPFIASLNEAQQGELKAKLSERMFGQNNRTSEGAATHVDPNLLKVFVDAVKDVVKLTK